MLAHFLSSMALRVSQAYGSSRQSVGQSFLGLACSTGRMVPSRANRSLMCLWGLFFGAYIAASHSGHRSIAYIFFGAFLACAISGIVIRNRHGREV